MKAVFFSVLALAASAIATPVLSESLADPQEADYQKLADTIKSYTANINKTVNAVSDSPSLAEQAAAAAAIAPSFQSITKALDDANSALSKRDTSAVQGGHPGVLAIVKLLVFELVGTVKLVLLKLGLFPVLVHLTPLLVSLAGLVKSLDRVVDGLLLSVKVIVDSLLGAVAAGLLKLF